jgi:ATP-dependent exoDNAse (exonuclease V) alpha subunit
VFSTVMAIYHLSVKAVSRSAGRSATAAAAYRSGCKIVDQRTGEMHDYTRRRGVESADIVLPDGAPAWALDRVALWNAAELAEKRKDACVAREVEVALPAELSADERRQLALDFARDMANREGCAVDVCIHAPDKDGDRRNHHVHMLRTTRRIEADGLGAKLDTEKAGRKRTDDLMDLRKRWAEMVNERLRRAGLDARVDHRSLADQRADALSRGEGKQAQALDRPPTRHLGPSATGYKRRTGQSSRLQLEFDAEAAERQALAKEAGELERQCRQIDQDILDLSRDIEAAKRERELQMRRDVIAAAIAKARAKAEAQKLAEQNAPSDVPPEDEEDTQERDSGPSWSMGPDI